MNLYVFNKMRCCSAVCGVGSYIRELTAILKESDINTCVVNLFSEKIQIQAEEINSIKHWYFPTPIEKFLTIYNWKSKMRELYLHNVVYLLHISEKLVA